MTISGIEPEDEKTKDVTAEIALKWASRPHSLGEEFDVPEDPPSEGSGHESDLV